MAISTKKTATAKPVVKKTVAKTKPTSGKGKPSARQTQPRTTSETAIAQKASKRTSKRVASKRVSNKSTELTPQHFRNYVAAMILPNVLHKQGIYIPDEAQVSFGTLDGRRGALVMGQIVRRQTSLVECLTDETFAKQVGAPVNECASDEDSSDEKYGKVVPNKFPDQVSVLSFFVTNDEVLAWLATK